MNFDISLLEHTFLWYDKARERQGILLERRQIR